MKNALWSLFAILSVLCSSASAQLKMPAKQITVDSSSTNAAYVYGNSSTTLQQVVEFYDPKIQRSWNVTQLATTNPANTEIGLASALYAKANGVLVSNVALTVNGSLTVTGAATLAQAACSSISTTGALSAGQTTVYTLTSTGAATVTAGGLTVTAGGLTVTAGNITAAASGATVGNVTTTGAVTAATMAVSGAGAFGSLSTTGALAGGVSTLGATTVSNLTTAGNITSAGSVAVGNLTSTGAAVVAALTATGGITITGAVSLPTNSVTSNMMAVASVLSNHVAAGAIANVHLADATIAAAKLSSAVVNAITPTNTAFIASLSSNYWATTSNAVPIIWDVEEYDGGGNYNPVTGVYTAPSAGLYRFGAAARANGTVSTSDYRQVLMLVTNNAVAHYLAQQARMDTPEGVYLNGTALVPMAAGDTAFVQFYATRADGLPEYLHGTNAVAVKYVSSRFWGSQL